MTLHSNSRDCSRSEWCTASRPPGAGHSHTPLRAAVPGSANPSPPMFLPATVSRSTGTPQPTLQTLLLSCEETPLGGMVLPSGSFIQMPQGSNPRRYGVQRVKPSGEGPHSASAPPVLISCCHGTTVISAFAHRSSDLRVGIGY